MPKRIMSPRPRKQDRRRFVLRRSLDRSTGPTTLVEDGFSGNDNDPVSGRSPDTVDNGEVWVGTAHEILSNQAHNIANGRTYIETGQADVIIYADAKDTGGSSTYAAYILARYQDATHYWKLAIEDAANQLQILEIGTLRASAAMAVDTVTLYSLIATLNGNSITLACGEYTCNYSSSSYATATIHGIGGHTTGGGCEFDNFKVTTL